MILGHMKSMMVFLAADDHTFSYQLSAISCQKSAVSYQHSAFSS